MNKNILNSLLRDVKKLRRDQEIVLSQTKLLENRLKDLINDEPKSWKFFGLKITRSKKNAKNNESVCSFTPPIQEHFYYQTPCNGTEL